MVARLHGFQRKYYIGYLAEIERIRRIYMARGWFLVCAGVLSYSGHAPPLPCTIIRNVELLGKGVEGENADSLMAISVFAVILQEGGQ